MPNKFKPSVFSSDAVIEDQRLLTYSQVVKNKQHSLQKHLESVFRTPTAEEMKTLHSFAPEIHRTIRLGYIAYVLCIVGMVLFIAGVLTALSLSLTPLETPALMSYCIIAAGFIMLCVSLIVTLISGLDNVVYFILCTLRTATAVYICNTGAVTVATAEKLRWHSHVDRGIYRPRHCLDRDAVNTIVQNEHNVFAVYSKKTHAVAFIDPLLFK